MDSEKSKLIKITNEIIFYCLNLGVETLHIDIINNDEKSQISLQCNVEELSDDRLEKLQELLEVPRREDIEDYLWELAGENQDARELSLVGMMIDEVKISYNKPQFIITMGRNK